MSSSTHQKISFGGQTSDWGKGAWPFCHLPPLEPPLNITCTRYFYEYDEKADSSELVISQL